MAGYLFWIIRETVFAIIPLNQWINLNHLLWSRRRIFPLVLFLGHLFPGSLFPQAVAPRPASQFARISLSEGLSQATVFTIYQDRKGFMWFGTADGLNQYDGYRFTVYKHDPFDTTTISDNRIFAICEDRSGTLWIGTSGGGLNKFDRQGKRFVHYKHDPSDSNSLSNNRVNSICQDKSGALWIGTGGGGMNRLDEATGIFTHYRHNPANPGSLSNDHISCIREDHSGVLWVATADGLNMLDRDRRQFTCFRHDSANPHSLSHNYINIIFEDDSWTLWIGTDDGLNRLIRTGTTGKILPGDTLTDLKRSAWSSFNSSQTAHTKEVFRFQSFKHRVDDPHSLSGSVIWSIYEDRSGLLWIGTSRKGLNQFDRENNSCVHYQHNPYNPNSLNDDCIRSIFEDQSGTLWIGTVSGGLNRMNRLKKKFLHYKNDPADFNSLSDNLVRSIYQDKDGILWVGTAGGGLNRFNREQGTVKHYLPGVNVMSFCEDSAGEFWIGTAGGLIRLHQERKKVKFYQNDTSNPASLSDNRVRCLLEDRTGVLWVGTYSQGLDRFERQTETFTHFQFDPEDNSSLSNNMVKTIFEDQSGKLWIGTYGGLNKFDRQKQIFRHYRHDPANPHSLSNDNILSIYENPADSGNTLWIGTFGGGLNKFDCQKEVFTCYTEKNGLANNVVYGILGDASGNLWVSTNKGISKFNPDQETFRNYDINDGLQSNEFNTGAYFQSGTGEMFFGGINGFNAFFPDSITDNSYIPPLVITAVKKFDEVIKEDISQSQEIQLTYRDKYVTFEFAALDYTDPPKNQYAYRMEGFDEGWIYSGTRRFATYTNLDPGEYRFMVKGTNNDRVWNEEGVSVRLRISPPYWDTWWFRISSAVLLAGLGLIGYRRRLKTVRMKTELQAAHDAQMSIMPRSDPQIPGFDISGICIPANEVGGDFFDYFWMNRRRTKFGIAIGDVSGKAMKSAMIAVMTSGMIYSRAHEVRSTREIMAQLNRAMYAKTTKEMFTALCLASLDPETKTITFTNGGLFEPLLISGNTVQPIPNNGTNYPLGIVKDHRYHENTLQLKTDDTLILVTDGVPEAQNPSRMLYGEERLKQVLKQIHPATLTAKQIKEKIVRDVRRFTGSAVQYDDMTVVVVKCQP